MGTPASSVGTERLVLWDFDGTLARHSGGWATSMLDVLAEHFPDQSVTFDDVATVLWGTLPWHCGPLQHEGIRGASNWWNFVLPRLADAHMRLGVPSELAREFAELQAHDYIDVKKFELFEDVLEGLRVLRDGGWRNAVVSNHVPELPKVVAHLGLDRMIDAVFTSALTGFEKPHPMAFRTAISRFGDPEDVWMVGDDFDADIRGAAACGISTLLLVRTADTRRPHVKAMREVIDVLMSRAANVGDVCG